MINEAARDLLRREITPELYREIRELWKAHSIAEDNRSIEGLMATLTDDCVYEVPQRERTWHGHEGATAFYTELLGAFPDVQFHLQHLVIGPQGVWEEAMVVGTHRGDWLDFRASGRIVRFRVSIYFPWDPERRKFRGERVFFDLEAG